MGWNSWNTFGGEISADLVKETADAFVSDGPWGVRRSHPLRGPG
jgi:hypothetical protein